MKNTISAVASIVSVSLLPTAVQAQRARPVDVFSIRKFRAFKPGFLVRYEAARQTLEKACSDAVGKALGLLDAGIPFSDSVGSYKAIFGHCIGTMRKSDARFRGCHLSN